MTSVGCVHGLGHWEFFLTNVEIVPVVFVAVFCYYSLSVSLFTHFVLVLHFILSPDRQNNSVDTVMDDNDDDDVVHFPLEMKSYS